MASSNQSNRKSLVDRIKQNRTSVIGLAAVLIAMGGFFKFQQSHRERLVPLFPNETFGEKDLNNMQFAFGKDALNDFEIRDDTVLVPHHLRSNYMSALANHGGTPPSIRKPTIPKSNPFESRESRKIVRQEAKRERLQQMLANLKFVDEALIEHDETNNQKGLTTTVKQSILIAIKPHDSVLNPHQVWTICNMVQGAFAGIDAENIIVADVNSGTSYNAADLTRYTSGEPFNNLLQANLLEQILQQEFDAFSGIQIQVNARSKLPSRIQPEPNAEHEIPTAAANQPMSLATDSVSTPIEPLAKPEFQVIIQYSPITLLSQYPDLEHSHLNRESPEFIQHKTNLKARLDVLAENVVRNSFPTADFELSVMFSPRDVSVASTMTSSIDDATGWNWNQLRRWTQSNWSALLMISASLTCIAFLLLTGKKKQNRRYSPSNIAERTRATQRQASAASGQSPRQPQRASRTGNNRQLERSPEDRQLQLEIAEYIRDNPGQASEILQEWMKDAA